MVGLKAALAAGPVWALGAMSGTSLDGVDAAMVQTDGARIFDFGPAAYRAYSDDERAVLRAALGHWPGEVAEVAAEVVEQAHAELLARFEGAALVGFHGQTLAHEPRGRGTHQAGDGQVLAEALGLPVAWDFRSNDVAFGGEGAPLAPFFHFACARWVGIEAPVAFLNLGGVGNLTWLDPGMPSPETPGACLAFDTGPANAPVNDLVRARLGAEFDRDGALAARGTIDEALVARFLSAPFFRRMPPKSLDRDEFAWLLDAVAGLSDADAVATLTGAAAAAVAEGIGFCPEPPASVLVTGGGRRNPELMAMLAGMLPMPVMPVEEVGLDGDMLEAQAFAYLAVRALKGWPTSAPGTTGVPAPVGGARLSEPSPAGMLPGGAR